ncbi:uncharacterized protein F4807DRAFT_463004 [Annulohypoxylon truncatum]|uniref:uncharacterized protein n=1 Tax=Annulohypoxylon truncatum TaxID=327061 RepID=UPI0020075656|nr:uncharacterized protein F4807DRAFT_463004 [Annulohypoxylon truncatum]KAI1206941.1 hypothetical protein F4807DRAFT_463004 [Annulohypoxylon truncatum]
MPSPTSPDYIIISGGASGLVVARHLSENPDVQVWVLEAGKDLSVDPRVNIPALWTSLVGSDADWQYKSVSQPGLGGHTLILLPDQATLEHVGIDWINDEHRGTSGPIKVSFPDIIQDPLCKAWIDAFRGLGKVTTADPFSGNSIGGYSNTATVDPETKIRSYANSSYGAPIRRRPNVRILTEAKVQRTLFTKTRDGTVKATGVHALVEGKTETFTPTKEVILASGVFNIPKLLDRLPRVKGPKDSEYYNTPGGKRNHPDAIRVGDLDGAKKYVLDTATTAYHGCGSAAMMPREKGGVVNPKLVVYGTKNIRVVNANVIPLIPRGNIFSSVYAVAEKAAGIIKGH